MTGTTNAEAAYCEEGGYCNYGAPNLHHPSHTRSTPSGTARHPPLTTRRRTPPPPGWNEVLTHMSPYGWGYYGIGLGLGCSVVGAAWGIWLTGSALTGAAVKAPRIRSKNLIR